MRDYRGEELQCSSIPQFKLISRLNPSITEEFKQLSKDCYKIEAKNSELKNVLGYDVSMGNCLYATKIQGACTIFAANIKQIITILDEKKGNERQIICSLKEQKPDL